MHNYLDKSIQEMSGFFATRIENLATPASPVDKKPSKKKKKGNSKKQKTVSFEDSDKDS